MTYSVKHSYSFEVNIRFNAQALVKLRGDCIRVTFYGHPREDEIAPVYHKLEEKLRSKGIDPNVSWLNNHPLEFQFK